MMERPAVLDALLTRVQAHQTKVRFLIAGAFNTLFGLAVFPIMLWALRPFHIHYMITLALSHIICVTFAYMNNKRFVFLTKGGYLREYGRFAFFNLFILVVNLCLLPIMVEIFGIPPLLAQSSFVIVVAMSSYFWHSHITFRAKGQVVG